MNKLDIAKSAAGFIASTAVGFVVGNVVKTSQPTNINAFGKVAIAVGSFILTDMVGRYAANNIEEQVDQAVAGVRLGSDIVIDKTDEA